MSQPHLHTSSAAGATYASQHWIPQLLDRRLRSISCRSGRDDCADTLCLCACHTTTHLDAHLRRVVDALGEAHRRGILARRPDGDDAA